MADEEPFNPFALRLRTLDDMRQAHLESLERMTEDIAEARHAASAEGFAEHLLGQIREFEAGLDDQHEVGIRLVTFGQATTFHVSQIGFVEPSLIVFEGVTEDASPVRLVQHVSQISFLLMKLARLDPDDPKTPIGFRTKAPGGF